MNLAAENYLIRLAFGIHITFPTKHKEITPFSFQPFEVLPSSSL